MDFEELVEQMTNVYKVMASSEFSDAFATMLWNIYTKCKEKGFTEEQAMNLALSFAKTQTK